jgi:hypothetical protein
MNVSKAVLITGCSSKAPFLQQLGRHEEYADLLKQITEK